MVGVFVGGDPEVRVVAVNKSRWISFYSGVVIERH